MRPFVASKGSDFYGEWRRIERSQACGFISGTRPSVSDSGAYKLCQQHHGAISSAECEAE